MVSLLRVSLSFCLILAAAGCLSARTPHVQNALGLSLASQAESGILSPAPGEPDTERDAAKAAVIAFLSAKTKAREAERVLLQVRQASRAGRRRPPAVPAELRARLDKLFGEAVEAFDRAIQLDERNAVAYREYGNLLRDFGRVQDAVPMWERAVELDPRDFTVPVYLVQVYDSAGDVERAIAMCKLAVAARPGVVKGRNVAAIRRKLAELYERSGKDANARDEYEALLRDYADGALPGATAQSTVYRRASALSDKLASLYAKTSQLRRGIKFFQWFIDRTQVDEARLALARLHFDAKDFSQAMTLARDYTDRKSLESGGHSLIVAIYCKEKRIDEAVAYCEDVLRERPGNNVMMRLLADLYGESGRIPEAVRLYGQIVEQHPKVVFFYLEFARFCDRHDLYDHELRILGQALDKQLDNRKVLSVFEAVLRKDVGLLPAADALAGSADSEKGFGSWYIIGEVFRLGERSDDAEKALEQSVKLGPGFLPSALALADVYLRHERYKDTADLLLRARDQGVRHPAVFNTIALCYANMGEYDLQVEILTEALQVFPDNRDLNYNFAIALDTTGQAARGQEVLERLLETDPKDAVVANALGYLYAEQNMKLDEAEKLVRKALKQDPKNGAYIDSLGWVYFKRGKLRAARRYLEKAIRYEKEDPEILDHLGDVYFGLKSYEKARDAWQRALAGKRKSDAITERVQIKLNELETVFGVAGSPEGTIRTPDEQ